MVLILCFLIDYSWKIVVGYDAINDFSVWLRTVSNPADINRFGSNAENIISFFKLLE